MLEFHVAFVTFTCDTLGESVHFWVVTSNTVKVVSNISEERVTFIFEVKETDVIRSYDMMPIILYSFPKI
jgi:hypothetical protein